MALKARRPESYLLSSARFTQDHKIYVLIFFVPIAFFGMSQFDLMRRAKRKLILSEAIGTHYIIFIKLHFK
ncbi:hypothetical protein CUMW_167760 [Citrus unshiu]|nr:hypothetical protein CUMW_167760 [Citrus unshiu]